MKKKNGFTLIELLATIVILAIIMVIATIAINGQIEKARIDSVVVSSRELKNATNLYKLNNNLDDISIDFETNTTDYGIDGMIPAAGHYSNNANEEISYVLWYKEYSVCVTKEKDGEPVGEIDVSKNDCLAKYNPSDEDSSGEKVVTLDSPDYACYITEENSDGLTLTGYSNSTDCLSYLEYDSENYIPLRKLEVPYKIDDKLVTKIGDSAFHNFSLKQVVIPSSVKSIGESAFYYSNIEKLTLSDGIEEIGKSAFSYNNLSELNVPGSVTIIEQGAFDHASIESLTLNDGLQTIGFSAFGYNNIKNVKFPKSVTTIEGYAFNTNNLAELNLPSNINNIGASAFANNSLTKVSYNCNNKTTISTEFSSIFAQNKASSMELTIGDDVTNIGMYNFANSNITKLKISKNVKNISYGAFYNNPIKEIDIEGDKTRFNSDWDNIGFPSNLKPAQ